MVLPVSFSWYEAFLSSKTGFRRILVSGYQAFGHISEISPHNKSAAETAIYSNAANGVIRIHLKEPEERVN